MVQSKKTITRFASDMKTLTSIYFLLCFTVLSLKAGGATITVVTNNGNWTNSSTWDLHRTPANGDIVKIPAGKTVVINEDLYSNGSTRPVLLINIDGIVKFDCEGELNLKCGSYICTFGAGKIPSTGSSNNQITIGSGASSWKGSSAAVTSGTCVTSPCSSSPLPVELLSFGATSENGTVDLSWEISSQINFDHFEVERSKDAVNFETLISISGSGSQYYYSDPNPIKNVSYYRLKEVDADNKFSYSNLVMVKTEGIVILKVFPNPATGNNFKLILPEGITAHATVIVKDIMGKELISESLTDIGVYSFENKEKLSAGIYFVELSSGTDLYSTRIVVQ
jgi:hypothetical protein